MDTRMRTAAAVLALAAVGMGPARAADAPEGTQWSVTAGVLRLDNAEHDARGERLNRDTGTLPAVGLGLRHVSGNWRFGTEFVFASGDTRYDGRTQGGAALTASGRADWRTLRVDVERQLETLPRLAWRLGADWTEWRRSIDAGDGVDLRYRTLGALAGARWRLADAPRWRLDLRADALLPLSSRVDVRYTGLYDPARLAPDGRPGARLGLSWAGRPAFLPDGPELSLEPFVMLRRAGRSPDATLARDGRPLGTLHEPASRRVEAGLMLRVGWRF